MAEPIELPLTEPDRLPPAQKVRTFPQSPGVYLMKDGNDGVIYVGKAKRLRSRASHYFTSEAKTNSRTRELVKHIEDIDFIPAASEVEAIFMESRLIKDIQPRFNVDLKDDKSFPYLQIRTHEEYPRVEFTRNPRRKRCPAFMGRSPRPRGCVRRYRCCSACCSFGLVPWTSNRTMIVGDGSALCILHSIRQCTAPCNFRVSREEYRKQIRKLIMVLEGKKSKLFREMQKQMQEASTQLQFEKAARIRDEIAALQKLELRGDPKTDTQTHVFPIDPKKGLVGLRKVLKLAKTPRTIEGFRHRALERQ